MACGFIRKRRYELFVRWKHIRRISCENRAAAHPGRGGICSGRCGAGGRMGAGAACADGLPMVGRSEFSGNGLRWSVGRRPRKRMCGISGGAAVGWRTEGSGRCVVGAGRVLECRASGVVPRTGGAGSSGSRAGVGPVRAGADRWARRGPAWTLCSGEAGMEPLPFPDGPVASPGRKASHLRAQRPPEGARCSVFGLFLSFSAASRRAGTDAVCKSAVSPLGKSEKVVFLFLLYN